MISDALTETMTSSLRSFIMSEYYRTRSPVLLTIIGSRRWEQINQYTYKELFPDTPLRVFIGKYLGDDLVLKQHPIHKPKIGAVPKDNAEDWAEWKDLPAPTEASSAPRRTFEQQFWNAFVTPASPGKTRFIDTEHPFTFMDMPSATRLSSKYKTIEPTLLPSSDESAPTYPRVYANICKWLQINGLEEGQFYRRRPSAEMDQPPHTMPSGARPEELFLRALGGLEPNDLQRITVPLDIVFKALRRLRP